jgi:hypothetical protein
MFEIRLTQLYFKELFICSRHIQFMYLISHDPLFGVTMSKHCKNNPISDKSLEDIELVIVPNCKLLYLYFQAVYLQCYI